MYYCDFIELSQPLKMASCQIPVPQPMCCKGNLEANWKAFGESWSDYRIATELDKKPDIVQVATLRTVMGQDCKDRSATLPLSDEDRKNPQIIVKKLAEHFAPARNVLYDRFVFHSASQQQNESVDQYVVHLRQLGKACKFGALEEEMIRDRQINKPNLDYSGSKIQFVPSRRQLHLWK